MAEMKHTPEPWNSISERTIGTLVRQEGLIIAKMRENEFIDHEANAARIVACVNSMQGIENPEQFVANALQNAGRLIELVQQLEELKNHSDFLEDTLIRIRNSGAIAPHGKLYSWIQEALGN